MREPYPSILKAHPHEPNNSSSLPITPQPINVLLFPPYWRELLPTVLLTAWCHPGVTRGVSSQAAYNHLQITSTIIDCIKQNLLLIYLYLYVNSIWTQKLTYVNLSLDKIVSAWNFVAPVKLQITMLCCGSNNHQFLELHKVQEILEHGWNFGNFHSCFSVCQFEKHPPTRNW